MTVPLSPGPTPEEVAAALAALLAAGPQRSPTESPDGGPASLWADLGRGVRPVRRDHVPAPHAWRTTFWPR